MLFALADLFAGMALLVFCLPGRAQTAAQAQGGETASRLIVTERLVGPPVDPIEIVNVKEGKEAVIPSVPFTAGDDWLRNLSITVRNTSQKRISRFEVTLIFLDLGDGTANRPYVSYDLEVGKRPEHARTSHSGERIPDTVGRALLLEPGLDLTIPFNLHFDRIKEQVETRQPISSIRRCSIQVTVFFSDQTMWAHGSYYLPDPSKPGRYQTVRYEQWQAYSVLN